MSDLHDCPKLGCGARIPFHRMTCQAHWYALPPELRRRVNATWRAGGIEAVLAVRSEVVAILNGEPMR